MKFLPYEHFKIKTRLTEQEVLKRLANAVEPRRSFRFFGSGEKPYQGKIEGTHFEVSRIISYRNSFLPMIKGDIEAEINGCAISISMQLHIFVIVFMIFWLGGVGFFFLATLSSFLFSPSPYRTTAHSSLLPLAGMFVFGCLLSLGGFKFEAVRSKEFFEDLFEAQEVEELGFANPF